MSHEYSVQTPFSYMEIYSCYCFPLLCCGFRWWFRVFDGLKSFVYHILDSDFILLFCYIRISQDLAKDLAMLAREIHDVAGDIDSVSPAATDPGAPVVNPRLDEYFHPID